MSVALNKKCYTHLMPTTRPRHMITESDELSSALDVAADRWPELAGNRSKLLRKILEVGIDSLASSSETARKSRLEHINKIAGSMSDTWPANWKEELGADWPA